MRSRFVRPCVGQPTAAARIVHARPFSGAFTFGRIGNILTISSLTGAVRADYSFPVSPSFTARVRRCELSHRCIARASVAGSSSAFVPRGMPATSRMCRPACCSRLSNPVPHRIGQTE
ncbi:hypothetical protein Bcep18194_B0805 [Burkholderia lata]|uniref:Uncharacterized protein n=1 Tax=Burkholderia lata (strain ATCC 17760 / DSM 23089 / LMG 22485 / NCIMB 9086 / R18194 / 383) TaxID=482957 RepID=Q399E2_BURL3|nr:hypothetical protein Bcep18194_B0805 [Burkholderia lata]